MVEPSLSFSLPFNFATYHNRFQKGGASPHLLFLLRHDVFLHGHTLFQSVLHSPVCLPWAACQCQCTKGGGDSGKVDCSSDKLCDHVRQYVTRRLGVQKLEIFMDIIDGSPLNHRRQDQGGVRLWLSRNVRPTTPNLENIWYIGRFGKAMGKPSRLVIDNRPHMLT